MIHNEIPEQSDSFASIALFLFALTIGLVNVAIFATSGHLNYIAMFFTGVFFVLSVLLRRT